MSLSSSMQRSDIKLRLDERRRSALQDVSDVGRMIRQIEGGTENEQEILDFLEAGAGMSSRDRETIEKLELDLRSLGRKVASLEKTGGSGKGKSTSVDPETITEMTGVANNLNLLIEEARRITASVENATTAALDASRRQETSLSEAAREARVSLSRAAETAVEMLRASQPSGADPKEASTDEVAPSGANVDALAERVSELEATLRSQSVSDQPATSQVPDDIDRRLAELEAALKEGRTSAEAPKRRLVSSFTTLHPRFAEVKGAVHDLLKSEGRPLDAVAIMRRLQAGNFGDVEFNPKDMSNRLTSMGLMRVVPVQPRKGDAKSGWWIPSSPTPPGFRNK